MKLSIVIPFYNAENTLKRCIDSLIFQMNNDVEVLLIDNCSNDNSFNVVKDYLCHNIKYYFCDKKGVSCARNLGIKESKGDFIAFLDADDFVYENYIDAIINLLCEYDLIVFGISHLKSNKKMYYTPNNKVLTKNELLKEINEIEENKLLYQCWNKIYCSKIIKDNSLFFDEKLSYAEDFLFVSEYIKLTSKIYMCDKVLYCQVINDKGLNFSNFKKVSYESTIAKINAQNNLLYDKNYCGYKILSYIFSYYASNYTFKNRKKILDSYLIDDMKIWMQNVDSKKIRFIANCLIKKKLLFIIGNLLKNYKRIKKA